ncbi:hypothetical protein GALMADRAFT_147158 [Galerina marginata CBS 339.88]|uniref:chitinase n=1 Tax=Galerina marginata (strain CBS 339.88) TaxID=685588 RepID=A0A067SI21_GALM3|nr:hypothetical protein GALMADRAFT_147158 [Galerina marginata CBS 339.88]
MPPLSSPIHRVVVYYQTQYHDQKYISPAPLIPVATHLIIAAIHLNDSGDNIVTLNNLAPDDSSLNQMWVDVARMQGSGVKVMGMLGGASDGSYKLLNKDFDKYYAPLSSFITTYGLDGIDLDVEVKSETYDDIVKLIKQLRSDFGTDFLITLAPVASALSGGSNLSGFDYTTLEANYGDDINWYNVQFYSGFGSMADTTSYDSIITYSSLDPSRLVAGTLSSDSGAGWVELDIVKATVRQLLRKYGNSFGGIAAWEYYDSMPDTDEPWTWAAVMKLAMVNWKEVLAAA